MNAPRVIAIVVVIAIAGYMLYGTFDSAVPKDFTNSPFDIELDDSGTSLEVDENMNLVIGLPSMTFTSHLPEDIKNVSVDVYLGSGDKKMYVGTFDFEDIPSEESVKKDFEDWKIPALMFMTYAGSLETDEEGYICLPIVININFEYMDWNGTSLLDLGIGLSMNGTVSKGTVDIKTEGNTATVTVSPDESSMVSEIIDSFKDEFGGTATISAGDSVDISVNIDGDGNLKVTATGQYDTAYAELLDLIDDDGVAFTYNAGGETGTFTLDKEQAEAIANALAAFFPEES